MLPLPRSSPARILDFDIETVAAGYADPQWVPNTTTVWAYGWIGESDIAVEALPVASFYDLDARREFVRPLLDAIDRADVLTGHNLLRWDLPVLVAECLLLNLPVPRPRKVQDTMRLPKSRGFKKGQDNLGHALDVLDEKMPLSWAQWAAAYAEPTLATVRERCVSDVWMHMQIRAELGQRGWLREQWWKP